MGKLDENLVLHPTVDVSHLFFLSSASGVSSSFVPRKQGKIISFCCQFILYVKIFLTLPHFV